MMKSSKECECATYARKDVTLPDGFSYHYFQCKECGRMEYPLKQAQSLIEYSREHVFFFVEDWILAWMATGENIAPVQGITTLQKQMVVIFYEFAQEHDIASENPGFRAYKFGPYTERIDRALQNLNDDGLISSSGKLNSNNERFYLTEKGLEKGTMLLHKLTPADYEDLKSLKRDLQQFTLDGIEKYVYTKYPQFTNESEIFTRVLHRRRT